MLRNLFMPTSLNNNYYIEQRIVSLEINKYVLSAVVIKARGKKRIVEQCLKQPVPHDETVGDQENIKQALIALFATIGTYNTVTLVLSSNQLFFKEITIPFTDQEKIKLVVPFEVESLLPVALQETTLDSIVLNKETHASTVMVAAIKNEYIANYDTLFKELNIPVTRITVDAFELFGLYSSLPLYASTTEPIALISLGFNTMCVMIIVNHQLKFIRVLSQGIYKLSRDLEPILKIKQQEILDTLINFGFSIEKENIHAIVTHFFEDLLFSLQLSINKLQAEPLAKIVITGPGADIKGIAEFLTKATHVPTELFQTHTIVHDGLIKIKNDAGIPQIATACLAASLTSPMTEQFNLLKIMPEREERIVRYQFIAACVLFFLGIGSFSLYSFFSIRSLKIEAQESEQEAINKLKKEFDLGKIREKTLEDVNNRARQELTKQENIWFALQNKSFLHYLQELSTHIDREGLGLNLKKLAIDREHIAIDGSVKDFDALKAFEEDLQESNLFVTIPKLHDIKFAEEFTLDKKL